MSDDCYEFIHNCDDFQPFTTPPSNHGRTVLVSRECYMGICKCEHLLDGVPCQLKPCRFAVLLFKNGMPGDVTECEFFSNIIDGFPVVESVGFELYVCDNYKSILTPNAKAAMDKIVRKELDEQMISIVNQVPHCVHALGAVDKPDGGIRPITDCSRPVGRSVNSFSSSLVEPFHYMSVDDVTRILEPMDYMAVVDIKSAYRAVAICQEHRKFLGFRWELDGVSHNFCDNRLCFGLRTGPCHYVKISAFVSRVLKEKFGLDVIHYFDNFLCKGSSYEMCEYAQQCVIATLRYLGFYISWKKLASPSQVTKYLGILIDSVKMELRLPEGKLEKIQLLLSEVKRSDFISKKSLEKLTGYLVLPLSKVAGCSAAGYTTYTRSCCQKICVALGFQFRPNKI